MSEDSWAVKTVMTVACRRYGVSREELIAQDRRGKLPEARMVVAYALRELFQYSYPQIGEILERDHTTVMSGYNRLKDLMSQSEGTYKTVLLFLEEVNRILALPKDEAIMTSVSPEVMEQLKKLLETGMYGHDLGDVVERLVCQQLQELKK